MTTASQRTARTQGQLDYFVGNANGRGLIRIEAGPDSPESGRHIASMPRGAQSEADADHIVRVWNSHDDLVKALEESTSLLEEMTASFIPCSAPNIAQEKERDEQVASNRALIASARASSSKGERM